MTTRPQYETRVSDPKRVDMVANIILDSLRRAASRVAREQLLQRSSQ